MVVPSLSWQMFGFLGILGYKWRKRAPFSHLVLMQSIVQPATKPCDIYNNIALLWVSSFCSLFIAFVPSLS
eukprot:COSAG06_NODE_1739_length_8515_cov_19.652804_2_plen_71_part_00